LLHAAQLTPVLLQAENDRELLRWRLGITNLCPRATRAAAELTRAELAAGARSLGRKVARLRPGAVALVGLSLVRPLYDRRGRPGPLEARLGGAPVFVLPNPSGLNATFPGFESKRVWFEQLRQWLASLRPE
jgi:TDG/mug DNA glycosylase family protein